MHAMIKASKAEGAIRVRRVRAADIADVARLDARVTHLSKPQYWNDIFGRYGKRRLDERFFLVAEDPAQKNRVLGFIVGEIRAWEFGSAPCGWVFALSVEPEERLRAVGSIMLDAMASEFKKAGITKMRTMVARNDQLPMLFFRSEGMMAGPYLQLEKDLP